MSQLQLDSSWPKVRNAQVVSKKTPEELELEKAISLLSEMIASPSSARHIKVHLARVKDILDPLLETVGDYHHMQARIEELEAEVDDRDEKIATLEDPEPPERPCNYCDGTGDAEHDS